MGSKKEKKPSIEDLAKERIVSLYRRKNKKLLLFSSASIKGKSGNVFAALDNTGITLFEYKDTYENKIIELENHSWKEWNDVLIDHYFVKTTFDFVGNDASWSMAIHFKGKEAQQIINNFTDITIQVVSRPWYKKILGFRSWKTWKMITATAIYSILLFLIINEFTSEKIDKTLTNLALVLTSLAFLGLFIGLIKPKYVLPFLSSKNRKRVGTIYGTLIILAFIMSLIFSPVQQTNQAQSVDEVKRETISNDHPKETDTPTKMDKGTDKIDSQPVSSTKRKIETKDELKSPSGVVLTPAVVSRVIDGDTIEVKINGKVETVRMVLVDTPETKHPRLGVQPFGPEASAFTKNTLTGKKIGLEKDVSDRDRYARLLRYVWLDGKLFNQMLIEKGLARVAIFQPDVKYVEQFRAAQQKVQKQAIGIWSIENYAQEDGYQTQQNKSKTAEAPKPTQETKTASGSCNIKGNISSSGEKIYHVPGGDYYDVTKPEQIFCSKAQAQAAGYRASKR